MILVVTILVTLHSIIDWYIIERMKQRPNHFFEGCGYVAACAVLVIWNPWLKVSSIALTARFALYEPLLNLLRGKGLLYNGQITVKPERKKSITDWIENKSGIPVLWVRISALAIFIVNILIL